MCGTWLESFERTMQGPAMADAGSGAYWDQLVFEAEGLRVGELEAAWREVVRRNGVLRTGVEWEGLREAVQVVWRRVEMVASVRVPPMLF